MAEAYLFDTVACSRWRRGDVALRRRVEALPFASIEDGWPQCSPQWRAVPVWRHHTGAGCFQRPGDAIAVPGGIAEGEVRGLRALEGRMHVIISTCSS